VMHCTGWDAFGLPAEQYAVKTGVHPAITTRQNIDNFRKQMKRAGLSHDWDREVDTTDPDYYRWTQWIFLKLYERGLAYVAEVPVNWCAELGTVLANEEVVDGRSEIGGYEVVRRPMRQWVLKITAYAEPLPIWIADYVLMSYGTGAIMAVPGHDERDWEFARQFGLPIREVVSGGDITKAAYTDNESGRVVNSTTPDRSFSIDELSPADA